MARAAADAGISGLAFYRGIPGCIGGALRMNAGAHGTETKDTLVEARAVTDKATSMSSHQLTWPDLSSFSRARRLDLHRSAVPGVEGDPAVIQQEMAAVADYREEHQPTRERTGGSTFKNPPDASRWQLVDAAGMRGFPRRWRLCIGKALQLPDQRS